MPRILVDPDSKSLDQHFAIIRTKRVDRVRYPEACVTILEGEEAARSAAQIESSLHPALVYGPSCSSEGQKLYYLVRWLT